MATLQSVENNEGSLLCGLSPQGGWPLAEPNAARRMRINIAPGTTIAGRIVSFSVAKVTVELSKEDPQLLSKLNDVIAQKNSVLVSGPFGGH